ncbi:YqaA family protein [Oceanospirillum sp.]|uniref:YqaA family protein n=1 Tax=Oceanospirillum sp. TaxID=2021254 RepID=UPI003A93AB4A
MTLEVLFLFFSAFMAATIFPFYSEAWLFILLQQGYDPVPLVIVASFGNTLGAVVNWYLGRYLLKYQHKRWFYFKPEQIGRMQIRFQRYGIWSLLMAWLPVVGDVLTLIAGIMRVHLLPFLALVATGKTLRYLAVVYFAGWFAQ